ncbi:MAG: glycosyltransferase family 4 protein, partial [Anaerohalosphaera sp.]|nr:glycosyltransferase family 4 protein [Anaerohalosphaera sp.]
GNSQAGNVNVLCRDSGKKRTSLSAFAKAIKQHLSQHTCDIIHSTLPFDFADIYQPRGGSYPETIIRSAASYENPITRYIKRVTHRTNLRRSALLTAERRLCEKPGTTIVAALSDYVRSQFKKHYRMNDQNIAVIPNAVKTDKPIDTKAADKLRAQIFTHSNLKEADNPLLCLFAANNFRLKGLNPLISALAIAKKIETDRPIYLVIAGSGSSRKYRKLAAKLGITDRTVFLGPLRGIQKALSICDVAVLNSFYDPCSRFILEALSAGKPAITTLYNGAAEAYTDHTHGRIIDDPRNIDSLAAAMVHYSTQRHLDQSMAAITADKLKENISITRHAKQLVELYEKIIASKGKA